MRTLFSTFFALALFLSIAPAASAYRYVSSDARLVTQYENYNYNKVFYDHPEEYWVRTSPYASETHALHPYWRRGYYRHSGITDPFLRSERFSRYIADAYARGYLGNVGTHPYDLPRPPATNARCLNYSVTQRHSRLPARFDGCQLNRRGVTPTLYYPYSY